MRYLLTNCRLYTGAAILANHAVLIQGDTIAALIPQEEFPAHVRRVDGQGLSLCPGFD